MVSLHIVEMYCLRIHKNIVSKILRMHFCADRHGPWFDTVEDKDSAIHFCRAPTDRLLLFGSQVSPKYKALYRYIFYI